MKTFVVSGIDGATGKPRKVRIEAPTEENAMGKARMHGINPSKIENISGMAQSPSPIQTPPPPTVDYASTSASRGASSGSAARAFGRWLAKSGAAASGPDDAPLYVALFILSRLLVVCGVIELLGMVVAFASAAKASGDEGPWPALTFMLGLFVFGVCTIAFGEALAALRDIARNSFNRR